MKRYFNEEPDKDKEDYGFGENDEEDDEEEGEENSSGIVIDMDFEDVAMQIDLMHTQLKERLLVQAREIAKQDIFWWFRSPAHKIRVIDKIFKKLVKSIYDEEEKEKKG